MGMTPDGSYEEPAGSPMRCPVACWYAAHAVVSYLSYCMLSPESWDWHAQGDGSGPWAERTVRAHAGARGQPLPGGHGRQRRQADAG